MSAVNLKLLLVIKSSFKNTKRSKLDYKTFKSRIGQINWSKMYNKDDVSVAFEFFINIIQDRFGGSKKEVVRRLKKN